MDAMRMLWWEIERVREGEMAWGTSWVGIKTHLPVCLHPLFPVLKIHQLLSETHRATENPNQVMERLCHLGPSKELLGHLCLTWTLLHPSSLLLPLTVELPTLCCQGEELANLGLRFVISKSDQMLLESGI